MLLHSNVITRIQIVSKVLSRDLPNTKLKFLVPLSINKYLFFLLTSVFIYFTHLSMYFIMNVVVHIERRICAISSVMT